MELPPPGNPEELESRATALMIALQTARHEPELLADTLSGTIADCDSPEDALQLLAACLIAHGHLAHSVGHLVDVIVRAPGTYDQAIRELGIDLAAIAERKRNNGSL